MTGAEARGRTIDVRDLAHGLLLVAIAGYLDAVGYLALSGLFVSFMSGNTTQFAATLASDAQAALATLVLIAAFVAGAGSGAAIAELLPRFGAAVILALECALIVMALVAAAEGVTVVHLSPLAVAMGLQNNLRRTLAGTKLGSTFVSGALVSLGQGLARHLIGRADHGSWLPHAATWGALVIGAIVGALIFLASGLAATLIAPAVATGVLAVSHARAAARKAIA
ncbi:YoaK family protein [Amorphus sp. 3PC139-8]|uniref:YoaK family protein n=1 Tax=Amorphus sp. 3PC139-8 TaxID=2735676 RepID=UPI00345CB0CC